MPQSEATQHSAETPSDVPAEDFYAAKTKQLPVWPPPQQSYRRRETLSPTTTLLLILVAFLLIGSGLGFIVYSTTTQYRSSIHAVATFEVLATKHVQQTAQARAQATANVLGTAQSNIEATATAQDDAQAAATAVVDDATATASAFGDLYTQATKGTPTLDNNLSDNTGKGQWDEGTSADDHTGCAFTRSAYHTKEAQQGYLQPCFARNTDFGNIAYTAHLTINMSELDQAGLLFRASSDQKTFYFFHISSDGSYALDLYRGDGQARTLVRGFSSAITTGTGQSNDLAVIAKDNQFYLYANSQYLDMTMDATLSSGSIGVAVIDRGTPIDAEFSNVQVWKL